MHSRDLRGFQNGVRGRPVIETADVFRDRTVEQGDILRQIADMPPQIFVAPLIDRGAVEPYDAMRGGPDSDQRL